MIKSANNHTFKEGYLGNDQYDKLEEAECPNTS